MRNVMNVKTFILHLKFNESNLDCYEYFAESDAVFKYYLSDIFCFPCTSWNPYRRFSFFQPIDPSF